MNEQGTIVVDGYPLRYRIEGEGTTVVVIGSATFYPRLFSERIRRSLRLVFVDHRGFVRPPGDAAPHSDAHSLDTVVDDLERTLASLGLTDVVLAGHSGHAFMAVAYAQRYPERVRKLALWNAAPTNSRERQEGSFAHFDAFAEPERKAAFERDFARLSDDLARDPERRFAHMCIRFGAHSFRDYTYDAAPLWEGVYTNMPAIDYLWGDEFARIHLLERLPKLSLPIYLGLGKYDFLVSPNSLWDGADRLAADLKKTVFERSGHYPMLEEPETFDADFAAWANR